MHWSREGQVPSSGMASRLFCSSSFENHGMPGVLAPTLVSCAAPQSFPAGVARREPGEGRVWWVAASRYQSLAGPIRGPALVDAPPIMLVPAISKRQLACSHGTDPHRCRPGQLLPEKVPALSPRQGYHWVDCAASCIGLGIPLRQREARAQPNGLPPCRRPPAPASQAHAGAAALSTASTIGKHHDGTSSLRSVPCPRHPRARILWQR